LARRHLNNNQDGYCQALVLEEARAIREVRQTREFKMRKMREVVLMTATAFLIGMAAYPATGADGWGDIIQTADVHDRGVAQREYAQIRGDTTVILGEETEFLVGLTACKDLNTVMDIVNTHAKDGYQVADYLVSLLRGLGKCGLIHVYVTVEEVIGEMDLTFPDAVKFVTIARIKARVGGNEAELYAPLVRVRVKEPGSDA
jgi:hypothetical protein